MKHLGLFEGIGGFSLAARWAGWETIAWCEWNEFGQKVLRHHFPNAEGHGDITKTDFKKYKNAIDIITGGFPCQPYSSAGKRKGKEDERHLWPEMLRTIREVQPSYVVGENVRGLTNWNGGLVFDEVQADLETQGYEVLPFLLPACAVNAPHRRDRIWFVAFNSEHDKLNSQRRISERQNAESGRVCKILTPDTGLLRQKVSEIESAGIEQCYKGNDTNTIDERLQGDEHRRAFEQGEQQSEPLRPTAKLYKIPLSNSDATGERRDERQSEDERNVWEHFPTQSPLCGRDDGLSRELDGITFPKWRNESLKAYGNAIVPQVAYEIYKAIEQYEILTHK